jgi:hypothetical protein
MTQNGFFGSKLNTVLLVILIILMVVAICLMLQTRALYLHPLDKVDQVSYQIYGDKGDLVSFSLLPGQKVSGVVKLTGTLKGGYFFEGAGIPMDVVTLDQILLKTGTATPTSEWTKDSVSFGGTIDFTSLPKGIVDIRIKNDNPSGLTQNNKFILIPVIVQ